MKNLLTVVFVLIQLSAMAQNPKEILYVGTYSESESKGIYVMEFDRNSLNFKEVQTVHDKKSPTFIALHPDGNFLYAAYREGADDRDPNGTIVAYQIDQRTGKLTKISQVSSAGASPCHISLDPSGNVVFVSHYLGGNLSSFKVLDNGGIGEAVTFIQHEGKGAHPERQAKAHMHSMIPSKDGKKVYASDLGLDKIITYDVDQSEGSLRLSGQVESQPGAGPRHFVLHPEKAYAYSLEELSNTVASYKVNEENGTLSPLSRIDILSEDIDSDFNAGADIHISNNGKWLYASNRGQDNIAIFEILNDGNLKLSGHVPSGGKHPRNFKLDEKGEFVFVANMNSDNIVIFSYNPQNGMLTPTGKTITIPRAVCIAQLEIPG